MYVRHYQLLIADHWPIWEVVKTRVAPTPRRTTTRPALQQRLHHISSLSHTPLAF